MRSTLSNAYTWLPLWLLCELGPGLGRRRGRLSIRVNDSVTARRRFPNTATVEELIGVTNDDMISAFGDGWRRRSFAAYKPHSDLSTGFTYSVKNKGHFISVHSGVMEEDRNAVPHKDFVVTTAEIESIKAQVKARYDLSNKPSCIKAPTDKVASKPPSANNQFNNQSTPRPQTGVQMKRKASVLADDGR